MGHVNNIPQCDLGQEFPEILSQNFMSLNLLSGPENSEIMHYGILMNMLYCQCI